MCASRLIALVVAISLFLTSVVYACSGRSSMRMASISSAGMDDGAMDQRPCNDHKQDFCKFVRDQMLSIQASSSRAEMAVHVATILQFTHIELPPTIDLFVMGAPPGSVSNPVFRFSFPFTSQVLRI